MPDHVTPNDVANMSAGEQIPDNMQEERSEGREFTPPASQEEFGGFMLLLGFLAFFVRFRGYILATSGAF